VDSLLPRSDWAEVSRRHLVLRNCTEVVGLGGLISPTPFSPTHSSPIPTCAGVRLVYGGGSCLYGRRLPGARQGCGAIL
jgi:hypothetical protein